MDGRQFNLYQGTQVKSAACTPLWSTWPVTMQGWQAQIGGLCRLGYENIVQRCCSTRCAWCLGWMLCDTHSHWWAQGEILGGVIDSSALCSQEAAQTWCSKDTDLPDVWEGKLTVSGRLREMVSEVYLKGSSSNLVQRGRRLAACLRPASCANGGLAPQRVLALLQ